MPFIRPHTVAVLDILDRSTLVPEADEPTADNTGLLSPWSLGAYPVYTGSTIVSTAGTIITGKTIDVYLDVRANNVTISDCLFRGPAAAPTSGKALCNFDNMTAGNSASVTDCEFDPQQPAYWINAIQGHHFVARRNKLHNCVDHFSVRWPSNATGLLLATIEQNYSFDHSYYSPDPNHAGAAGDPVDGQSHNDGVQLQGGDGTGSVIRGNAFWGNEYSATAGSGNAPDRGTGTIDNGRYSGGALKGIQFTNLSGHTTNIDILGNWFYGFNRGISGSPSTATNYGRAYRNKFNDAQNERVGSSLTAGAGYAIRYRSNVTVDTGDGTANANVYMSGLTGITGGSEITVFHNG